MTLFEPATLPDEEKRQLCEELLTEFGVARWRTTVKGEMIHSCPIPGAHANGDRNPSASLNYKKLTFNCLGCGSRGGLYWFLATCRGEAAESVREWLGKQTGTGGQEMPLARLLEILDAYEAPSAAPPPIPRYAETTLNPWTGWRIFHPYLTDERGCPPETLAAFRVGYTDEYPSPTGPQERVVIPLFWKGELVGWQARRLDPWDEPKYRFSPDFPRDRVLFNYHQRQSAVVVESPLSVLRRFHHMPEMLATFGAEVTEAQLRLLHRYQNVFLWFDNDEAGWTATEEVGTALEPFVGVWVVQSPYTADPAEFTDRAAEVLTDASVPFAIWERPKQLRPYEVEA